MDNYARLKSNLFFALIASLTLGLAPFVPEPHIVGKIRWIAGGAHGMQMIDYLDLIMHGLPWILLIIFLVKFIKHGRNPIDMDIQTILKDPKTRIIDVREPSEFDRGSLTEAVNMPLSQFDSYIEEIRMMDGPKVLFCRVGSRSAQAIQILNSHDIEDSYNGGGLRQMEYYLIPEYTK
ncbi:MAG: rhodanese-like domain-containing protein [Bacteroidia bacterium]|nr:rhodanese-like domain-containing protein [Bacteroidia bacterium]